MTPDQHDRPTAVIAGCGDLGGQVGLRLAASGHHVVGLRRRADRVPDPIEGRAIDITTQSPRLPQDTAIVVVVLTADARTAESYQDTFVAGLENLLGAIAEQVPATPRTLLVSSTSVYGVSDGSRVDERTPASPGTSTGRVLRRAEELLHARLPGATVLRLGGLYGPGRGTLLSTVSGGTATLTRTPVYTNRIHRDDAAAAIAHLTTRGPAPEPVYLGVDDEPCARAELLRFLADELGVAHPPVVEERSGRGQGKRCSNDRLRATGFTFAYPTYREGYRALISAR